ncbi:helix-turn-helix domain-containing protein [Pseudorhodoferax sp. Leaf274]|uniref:helix-turn-helix domain-containing protein n=1 Tax=Pseudorhodoferax sp. Leaf274 TaxID=1736318 RepID=UPI000702B6DA|nr:helix-turn-helix domain-containing protein [Pseudorhodoferax sp. Leaf274]KQP41587.1 AraC family transcriptional regulator [Pseudorhodoferax sp. Leaf274]
MAIEYSTAAVAPVHRFDYWSDVVCRHCIPAASRMLAEGPFDGALAVRHVGVVDIATMAAPLHHWSRESGHLRIRDDDDLWIACMRAGEGVLEQGGRQARLRAHGMVLYDAARPFQCTMAPQAIDLCRFPRRALLQRYPGAERMTALLLDDGKPAAAQLRALIAQAADIDFDGLRPGAAERFGSTLLDLLGLVLEFQADVQERPAERDLHARMSAYVQRYFLEPGLCLQTIADAHHVSTRTVTRAFARHGHTPMGMVWQLRLQASRQALAEGRARSVTEAAFDHGFSDVSHYSRAFRKAFGSAPHLLLRSR